MLSEKKQNSWAIQVLLEFVAALVTDQATVDQFGGENGVVAVGSDSDKKTKSLVKSHVQFLDFVYCSLDNYLSHLNGETLEEKVVVSFKHPGWQCNFWYMSYKPLT